MDSITRAAGSETTKEGKGVPLDPITLEVLRNKFDIFAEEMQHALTYSASSHTIKEAEDASAALFDVAGETIAQATALPVHLGMLIPAVRRIVEVFPPSTMRDGDAYIMNDPYQGGTHIPDLTVVVPVMFEGHAVALSCSMAHHQDLGGKSPGSLPTDSTEIFQEGLIVPPCKLVDQGKRNDLLFEIIAKNVRVPGIVLGDLDAQLACGAVGRRRVLQLIDEYGVDVVLGAIRELMDRSEAMTRECIRQIPDGEYVFTDYMDNDGVELDRRLQICAHVTVSGSDISVNFEGTSGQARGPINAVPSATVAAIYYVIRAITDPTIPNNGGCFRVAHIRLPEASLVNPSFPAPVNARTATVKRIADTLLGALANAMPDRIPAAPAGVLTPMIIGGRDPRSGQAFVFSGAVIGGLGARPSKDGISAVETDVTNIASVPVESLEMAYPIRFHRNKLRKDSAGAGTFRGGLGMDRLIEILGTEVTVTIRGERHFVAPWGLHGGAPGTTCRTTVLRIDGTTEPVLSKRVFTMRQGDRLELLTSGGGGYGTPYRREPEAVLSDVLDQCVSGEQARSAYGVVLTADGSAVDRAATESCRRAAAATGGAVEAVRGGEE